LNTLLLYSFPDAGEDTDNNAFEAIHIIHQTDGIRPDVNPPTLPLNSEKLPVWTKPPTQLRDSEIGYLRSVSKTYDQMREIEKNTREQNSSELWHKERKLRLTASNFGLIVEKTEKPRAKPKALVEKLLNPPAKSPYVEKILSWGTDNEEVAVQVYQSIKKNAKIFKCGLIISPEDPFLAASPDRIVYDTSAEVPWGLIEVKCPWSARNMAPTQAAASINGFYLEKCLNAASMGTGLQLNTKKYTQGWKYYMQMQGQMALSGARWCDFVVYTTKGIFIERVDFDYALWKEHAQILQDFLHKCFISKAIQQ